MALQDILKKIIAEAEQEAQNVHTSFSTFKKEQEAKAKTEGDKALKELKNRANRAEEDMSKKVQSMTRLEEKKIVLEAKQEIIETALKKFYDHICSLDDASYGAFIEPLVLSIKESKGTFLVPTARESITKKYLTDDHMLKTSETIAGGFVFTSETKEIDNSFYNLIFSEYHNDLESYFSKQLKLIS